MHDGMPYDPIQCGFCCYDSVALMQNVSKYLYSLYAWLFVLSNNKKTVSVLLLHLGSAADYDCCIFEFLQIIKQMKPVDFYDALRMMLVSKMLRCVMC